MQREPSVPAPFAVRFRDRGLGYLPAAFREDLMALAARNDAIMAPRTRGVIARLMRDPGPGDLAHLAEQIASFRAMYQDSPPWKEERQTFGKQAFRLGGDFHLSLKEVEAFCTRFFDHGFECLLHQEALRQLRDAGIPDAALRRQLHDYFTPPVSAADFVLRKSDGRDFYLTAANAPYHVR